MGGAVWHGHFHRENVKKKSSKKNIDQPKVARASLQKIE